MWTNSIYPEDDTHQDKTKGLDQSNEGSSKESSTWLTMCHCNR